MEQSLTDTRALPYVTHVPRFVAALVIILAAFLAAGLHPPVAYGKVHERDQVMRSIQQTGYARVIVTIETPHLRQLLRASSAAKAQAPAHGATQGGERADNVLAQRLGEVSRSVLSRIAHSSHRLRRTFTTFPFVVLDVSGEALQMLESLPEVSHISIDRLRRPARYRRHAQGVTSVPETGAKLPQAFPQNVDTIGASQAWASGYTGEGWYVAVLDTGIYAQHDMFRDKDIVEACFSANRDCPDASDEMHGQGAAHPFDSATSGYEHGTHVAGIAAGNSAAASGVAKNANIIAVQIFSRFTTPALCGRDIACIQSYDSDQLRGLEYVYQLRQKYKIASVNLSVGGDFYMDQESCDDLNAPLKSAIDNLRAAGISTTVSAGNDGYCDALEAPACISSAIAVGAVDANDRELGFNDWHYAMLDLLAPGNLIYSAVPDSASSYDYLSGTSMASPHVAGAWAVLKQKNPDASVPDIFYALSSTGKSVGTTCITVNDSKPRVQVSASLDPALFPVPAAQATSSYAPEASPVLNVPGAMPVGVGPATGLYNILNLRVGFYRFSGPVDIYFGFYAPSVDPGNLYLFTEGNGLHPLSQGLIPWRRNISGPLEESLFGEIPLSLLPSGAYQLYLAVTPSGAVDRYDLWITEFAL